MSQQTKAKKVGRPPLPKGRAKRIVPVRVKSNHLKRMNSAAQVSKKTLSAWIRGSLKNALKQGGFMTVYEQQVESGKEIVQKVLANLAIEFHKPEVNELSFKITDQDFDHDRISLIDKKRNIVTKIEEDDLADCPADAAVRRRLEAQLRQAIQASIG